MEGISMNDAGQQERVSYTKNDGGIAHITLERDRALNAIDAQMMRDLWAALDRFHIDEPARVAIISGSGRAFCVGADIKSRKPPEDLDPTEDLAHLSTAFLSRDRFKPIIASVHGHVVGAGLRMSLLSDFVICGESALFRAPEVQHGLNAGFFWSILQARAGDSFATDVVATGRTWTAQEAVDRGLVTKCVADNELRSETLGYAELIADQPPVAMEAVINTRRASLRRLDLQSWESRGRNLGWRSSTSGSSS